MTLEVPSPTFTLAQNYELPSFALVHADLYRINDASELEEIGLSPLPDDIVALIEWPERAPERDARRPHRHRAQPPPGARVDGARCRDHRLRQELRPRSRGCRSCASSSSARASSMPGASACRATPRRAPMRGCASDDGSVDPDEFAAPSRWPGDLQRQVLQRSGASRRRRPAVRRDRQRPARSRAFSAPAIRHADLESGFLITEDLGADGVIEGDPPHPIAERYEAADRHAGRVASRGAAAAAAGDSRTRTTTSRCSISTPG